MSQFSLKQQLTPCRLERNIAIIAASVPAMRPLLNPFTRLTSRCLSYVRRVQDSRQQQSYEFSRFPKPRPSSSAHAAFIETNESKDPIIQNRVEAIP